MFPFGLEWQNEETLTYKYSCVGLTYRLRRVLGFTEHGGQKGEDLTYSDFEQHVREKRVSEVVVQGQQIRGTYGDDQSFFSVGPDDQAAIAQLLDENNIVYEFQVVQDDSLWITAIRPCFQSPYS